MFNDFVLQLNFDQTGILHMKPINTSYTGYKYYLYKQDKSISLKYFAYLTFKDAPYEGRISIICIRIMIGCFPQK